MASVLLVPFVLDDLEALLPALDRQLRRSLGLGLEIEEPRFDIEASFSLTRNQY